MMIYWAAFLLGIAGSFHCIGMCGAIACRIPIDWKSSIGYHAGRICSYAVLGIIPGVTGQLFTLAGFGQWLSIIAAVVTILFLLVSYRRIGEWWLYIFPFSKWVGNLSFRRSSIGYLLAGVLNGFLPCGWVYFGLSGAIVTGSIPESMLYMAIFGLGTVPSLLVVQWFGKRISVYVPKNAFQFLILVTAVLFMLRGANLGIPYISPSFKANKVSCH